MMILQENEVCMYASQCPYNEHNNCFGSRADRGRQFTCDYVKDGKILEGQPSRIPGDETGRMKVIVE